MAEKLDRYKTMLEFQTSQTHSEEVTTTDIRKLSLLLLAIVFLYEFDWFATHYEISRAIATEANVLINAMGGIASGKVALFKAVVLLIFVISMGEFGRTRKRRFRKAYAFTILVLVVYSAIGLWHFTIFLLAHLGV